MNFKVTESEVVFRGRVFDLRVDQIEYTSGNKGVRETAVHPGGAVISAITPEEKIVLVRQFRYPLETYLFELPAGKLEKGEDPLLCATRELTEETGYRAEKIVKLSAIPTAPGFCSEILHIYLATGLTPGEHAREEGEQGMEVFEYTIPEIEEKILSGQITDSKTIAGVYLTKLYLEKNKQTNA